MSKEKCFQCDNPNYAKDYHERNVLNDLTKKRNDDEVEVGFL